MMTYIALEKMNGHAFTWNYKHTKTTDTTHIYTLEDDLLNRSKSPIDLYSRFLKNVKSQHAHLHPVAAIWLRLLMTTVYNAYQTFVMRSTEKFLLSGECKLFWMFQKRWSPYLPLRKFCCSLVKELSEIEVTGWPDDSSSDEEDDQLVGPL